MKIGKAGEDLETNEIPFGKYKGVDISEIPDNYLEWLIEQQWFKAKFKKLNQTINDELTSRAEHGDCIPDEFEDYEANDLPWYDFDGQFFDPYD